MSIRFANLPLRQILFPILSTIFLILCTGYYTTFVSLRLQLEGFSPTTLGYVHSAYFCGALLAGIGAERLVRSVGHLRCFLGFTALSTLMLVLQGFLERPELLATSRMVAGICFGGMWIVTESWFLSTTSPANRGRLISLHMTVYYAAVSVSQFIVGTVDSDTSTPFYITCLICSLTVLPVALIHTKMPALPEPSEIEEKSALTFRRVAPFGVVGSLLSGLLESAIYSFVPDYAVGVGLPVTLIMSVTIAGGLLLQWPIGQLSDRFNRRRVLVAISVISHLATISIILFAGYPVPVMFFSFLLGGSLFIIYPLSAAQVCNGIHPRHSVAITGLLLIAYELGSTIGPFVVPPVMVALAPMAPYACIALAISAIGITGVWVLSLQPASSRNKFGLILMAPIRIVKGYMTSGYRLLAAPLKPNWRPIQPSRPDKIRAKRTGTRRAFAQ